MTRSKTAPVESYYDSFAASIFVKPIPSVPDRCPISDVVRNALSGLQRASQYTGARISAKNVVFETVQLDHDGQYSIVPRRSRLFELRDRDQLALRQLSSNVALYFAQKSISDVILYAAPSTKSDFSGSPLGFKVEAVLQLIPHVKVYVVEAVSVVAWTRKTDCLFPAPPGNSPSTSLTKERMRAIQVACLAGEASRD